MLPDKATMSEDRSPNQTDHSSNQAHLHKQAPRQSNKVRGSLFQSHSSTQTCCQTKQQCQKIAHLIKYITHPIRHTYTNRPSDKATRSEDHSSITFIYTNMLPDKATMSEDRSPNQTDQSSNQTHLHKHEPRQSNKVRGSLIQSDSPIQIYRQTKQQGQRITHPIRLTYTNIPTDKATRSEDHSSNQTHLYKHAPRQSNKIRGSLLQSDSPIQTCPQTKQQ